MHQCVWSACPVGCVRVSFKHSLWDCISKCSWVPKHEFPKMHLNMCFFFYCFFLPVLLGYNWHTHCMSFRYIASHFDVMSWNKDHDQLSDEYRCIWRSHRNYWFSSLVEPRSQAELYMQDFFFFLSQPGIHEDFKHSRRGLSSTLPRMRFSPLFSYQVTKNTYFLCQEEV